MLTADGQNSLEAINCLQQGNFDVFHPTFFYPYFLKYLNGKSFVLTIHDMIPELVYENHNDPQVARKAQFAKQASHIITVSEKTKEDIINVLHIPDVKITVIPHGVVLCKPEPVDINYLNFASSKKEKNEDKKEINDVCLSHAFTIVFVDSLAALGIAQTSLALLSFAKELSFNFQSNQGKRHLLIIPYNT